MRTADELKDDELGLAFRVYWREIQARIHKTAREKGWWDAPRNDSECLMLMVTELAEACEALRNGNQCDDKIVAFSGVEAELADCIVRIMDYAEGKGHDVVGALIAKIKFNMGRERKHGKQF